MISHETLVTKRVDYEHQLATARAEAERAIRVATRIEGAIAACDELLEADARLASVPDNEQEPPCPASA